MGAAACCGGSFCVCVRFSCLDSGFYRIMKRSGVCKERFFLPDWVSRQLARLSAWAEQRDWSWLPDGITPRKLAVLGTVVFLLFVGVSFLALSGSSGSDAVREENLIYLRIEPGMTADKIGALLEKQGIVSSKFNFWLTAKLNGAESKFQTGTYKLHTNMEAREVLRILISGKT